MFFILMGAFLLAFLIMLPVTHGYASRGFLNEDRTQTFMDFFNRLLTAYNDPYDNYRFYTPLSMLFYGVLVKIVPESKIKSLVVSNRAELYTENVKLWQAYWIPFLIFALLSLSVLFYAIYAEKSGSMAERCLFIALVFLSVPALFAFERGSDFIITFALVIIFFHERKAKKRFLRELSIVILGFASAFALWPLLFVLLLLSEKRFWDVLKVLAYSVILFVVPYVLLYGDLPELWSGINTELSRALDNVTVMSGQLNFPQLIMFPLFNTDLSVGELMSLGNIFGIITVAITVSGIFLAPKTWQKLALISALTAGCSLRADTHLLIIFVLPVISLLNDEKKNTPETYAGLIIMTCMLAMIPSYSFASGSFNRSFITKFSSYGMLLLIIMLFAHAIIDKIRNFKKKGDLY